MPRRIEACPAHVLTSHRFRETSLLLEVFTRDHGRLGIVARGVRGAKSKRRGELQLFAPLLLAWTESGELGSLTAAESDGAAATLVGERIFHGWYLNELIIKLLPRHDPHPALYQAYARIMTVLAGRQSDADIEAALRAFELTLLSELGYGIELPPSLIDTQQYHHDAELGLIPHASDKAEAYQGSTLIALRDGTLSGASLAARRQARKLLGAAIARQLAGRELQTPQLLRAMRARINPLKPGPS